MRKKLLTLLAVMLSATTAFSVYTTSPALYVTKAKPAVSKKDSPEKSAKGIQILPSQKSIRKTADFRYIRPFTALALPAPLRTPALTAATDGPVIYGSVIYADSWTQENAPIGIYSFPSSPNLTLSEITINSLLSVNGGGVYVDGKYHYVEFFSFLGITIANYHTFDTETWEEIGEGIPVDKTSIASDLAFDPVTLNVYGCFYNETGDGYMWGTLDLETGVSTKIEDLPMVLFAIGADSKGDMYGIGGDGNLYEINKGTGITTLVGPTGVIPNYSQSGTFDPKTDKFYWAACLADETSGLYEVNTSTGTATLISPFPDNEEITGIYIPAPAAEDGAPAAIENLTVTFTEGTLTGNVGFTLPDHTFAGAPLTGPLSYSILFNNEEKASGTGDAGSVINREITVTAGMYTVSATTSNAIGTGPAAKIKTWIGKDAPKAVTDLNLQKGNSENELILTWNAPSEGIHNGYLDTTRLRYKVVRYPEGETATDALTATTFSETVTTGQLANFWYTVTAFSDELEGETATSNKVALGTAFTVPYFESFDTETDFGLFTVIDANDDGKTWSYDSRNLAAKCTYSADRPMNDWLITPPVALDTDRLYRLYFRTKCGSTSFTERLKVAFGNDKTESAMTTVLIPATDIVSNEYTTMEALIQAPAAGNFHIGFQSCSDADMFSLYIDSIGIEAGPSLEAPDAVTDLQVKTGEGGSLEAAISFKAPEKTVKGETLSALAKIDIYRYGTLIKTFENPVPGSALNHQDTQAKQGNNLYKVIASNEAGAGKAAQIDAYIGIDIPDIPTDITLKEVAGKAVITWKAPTTGVNGGYINPAALTYYIQRSDDEIVAEEISALTFTDEPDLSQGQQQIAYYVFAASEAGIGNGGASNVIVMGEPYTLPFSESFTGASLDNGPWGLSKISGNASWSLVKEGEYPVAAPQDNDGGMASFISGTTEGDAARIYSGKIDLAGSRNPALIFYYYFKTGATDQLIAEIAKDGGEFTSLRTIELATSTSPEGWNKVNIPLTDFISAGYIQIGFKGITGSGEYNLHLDNIKIKDLLDNNLAMVGINLPKKTKVGENMRIDVTITNEGTKEVGNYTVELYRNGRLVNTLPGENLQPEEVSTYTFTETPTIEFTESCTYYALINNAADMNPADNKSEEVTVTIVMPAYPTVTDLAGECQEGKAVLTWSEPDYSTESRIPEPFTDDIESYEPFIISDIGEWTVIDVDGEDGTYGISNGGSGIIQYPNAGAAMAFQVFNPAAAGVAVTDQQGNPTGWAPHSGDQMLAAFADEDGQNDDWLISPELTGTPQTISFYAKSVTDQYGLETVELLYSLTNADRESFQKVTDPAVIHEVPIDWTLITTTLPEGAKYFAIRCTSPDRFALLVDDITFTPASAIPEELSLIGYHIYRDGVKITDTPVTTTTYTDAVPEPKEYKYKITALYDKGESAFSNEIAVMITTAIDELLEAGIQVYGTVGAIEICHAAGMEIHLYTTDGKLLYEGIAEEKTKIRVDSGKYIIKIGNKATKILVK